MENSIIVSVNTVQERDAAIKKLYKSLQKQATNRFTIQQDQVNRIKVFHNKGNMRVLITTYLVIVLPIIIDLSPLDTLTGTVDFRLDETIIKLETLAHHLRSLQGKRVVQRNSGTKDLAKALLTIF
jgi:hypothetical protein